MKTAQQLVAETKSKITEASIEELAAVDDHALVIDIREPTEYSDGHIANAINLPRGVLEFQLAGHPAVAASGTDAEQALEKLRSRPVYLICRSGGRSALAAESLQTMGLENVYSVAGGMQAWQDAGKPQQR